VVERVHDPRIGGVERRVFRSDEPPLHDPASDDEMNHHTGHGILRGQEKRDPALELGVSP
jgi:hypothetical protein